MAQETELIRKPGAEDKRAAELAPSFEFLGGIALAHRNETDTGKSVSGKKREGAAFWKRPWPLAALVPIVSGALILAVAIVVSRVMMFSVAHEQELGVRQIAAVYLDGISTTVYPHVVARNLANTTEALRRTMWFHQGMREQRAIVQLPDGTVFADVSGPNGDVGADDPLHDADLRRQLEQGGGFVFDEKTGTGWAARAIVRDGKHVADFTSR